MGKNKKKSKLKNKSEEAVNSTPEKKRTGLFQRVKGFFKNSQKATPSDNLMVKKSKTRKEKKKEKKLADKKKADFLKIHYKLAASQRNENKSKKSDSSKAPTVSAPLVNSAPEIPKKENIKTKKTNKEKNKELFNVTEIFYSIQGESSFAGLPCVFVRLQGCNLRCSWCDTGYALNVKKERDRMSSDDIIEKIKKFDCKNICITGGEPLMQKRTPELLSILCNNGYTVALETNGYHSLKDIDKRVSKIVDFKCPGSKMQKKNNFENIQYLTKKDEIKFVIKDKEDYRWAKHLIVKESLPEKVNSVLLSPVFGKLEPKQLSKWLSKDNINARLQLQLHKYIWHPKKRGV